MKCFNPLFRRRGLSLAVGSTLSLQRRYLKNTNEPEDDFVDLMFPESSASLASSNHVTDLAMDTIPLGVQRDEPLQDTEFKTRLGVIAQKVPEEARQGTRAFDQQNKKGSQSDLARADECGSNEEHRGESEDFQDPVDEDGGLKGIDLPYEDEQFAETILRMEVEGQLDESWQNSRSAKIEDCQAIADILRHMKARDLCVVDVSQKTSSFDYIIIATCEGPRHVHLCSWSITQADREHRISKPKRASSDRNWEVVPVGRIIVNLMVESARSQMSLERKWAVTKTMDPLDHANATVSEGRAVKAHGLWTLTLNLQDLEDFEVDYCKDALLAQL